MKHLSTARAPKRALRLVALVCLPTAASIALAKDYKRYENVQLPSGSDGAPMRIWARNRAEGYYNALAFCRAMKDGPAPGPRFRWGYTCGPADSDEGYLDYVHGAWIVREPEEKPGPSLCERTGYCPVDQHGWPLGTAQEVKCDLHGFGNPILDWVDCGT